MARDSKERSIVLTIPGRPKLKSNYRAKNKGGAFFNIAADYEENIATHARAQLRSLWGISAADLPLYPKPHRVMIAIVIAVKSRAGDATNYPKSICDALQGIVYDDDAQIVIVNIIKLTGDDYVPIDGGDGALIMVSPPVETAHHLADWRKMLKEIESVEA